MDIIKRNFFRLLRIGAFNEYEPVEPMSDFKWNKLYNMIVVQDVAVCVASAVKSIPANEPNPIPRFIIDKLFEDKNISAADITRQYARQPAYTLCNTLLNRKLAKIRNNELHAIDTSIETLDLLNIIVGNIDAIITNGISYNKIIPLGLHLRRKGDKVDFVKLEKWMKSLLIQQMGQFIGSILITTLNFEQEEIPFVQHIDNTAYKRSLQSLTRLPHYDQNEWHFRQGRSGLLHNNSTLLRNNLWHRTKYLTYAPIETISNFMQSFTNSLSEIEE
ncbi:MAG: hypothetical protein ACI3YB_08200 [Prevotella sp.]